MVPFTYWKRATDRIVLRRLLCHEDGATPRTIQFVASRALGILEVSKCRCSVRKDPSHLELGSLIQERIRQTKPEEWSPSGIISVVYYLARARCQLRKGTSALLYQKIYDLQKLNVIDLWQLLGAAKRLRLELPMQALQDHLRDNIGPLLNYASCSNVYSMLNAFSACGSIVEPGVLAGILGHYLKDGSSLANLREAAKLANALATQLYMMAVSGVAADSIQPEDALWEPMGRLIKECIAIVDPKEDDLESLVDTLEALVLWNASAGSDGAEHQAAAQIQMLLSSINCCIRRPKELLTGKGAIAQYDRGSGCHLAEPRLLRRVIRSMMLARAWHPELFDCLMADYRAQPSQWSQQGTCDVLGSLAYFQQRGGGITQVVRHTALHCDRGLFRHVDPGKTFLDTCMVAASSLQEPCLQECLELVAKIVDHLDSIKTADLALGMMLLEPALYNRLPLYVLQKVHMRLSGSHVGLQVHTCPGVTPNIPDSEPKSAVYSVDFSEFCKVKLFAH